MTSENEAPHMPSRIQRLSLFTVRVIGDFQPWNPFISGKCTTAGANTGEEDPVRTNPQATHRETPTTVFAEAQITFADAHFH